MFHQSGRQRRRQSAPRKLLKRNCVVEPLGSRTLLSSVTLTESGAQTITPATPKALDGATFPTPRHEAEMQTAVDPTNPLNVAVAIMEDKTFGGDHIQEYYSKDGGKTWGDGTLNGSTGFGGNDPGLVYDANGHLFLSYNTDTSGISVIESSDQGATFRYAIQGAATPIVVSASSSDKDAIATGLDPVTHSQALYVTFNGQAGAIVTVAEWDIDSSGFLVSEVGPVECGPTNNDNDVGGVFNQPAVGPSGELYLSWWSGVGDIYFNRDTDGLRGPNSWSKSEIGAAFFNPFGNQYGALDGAKIPADHTGIFINPVMSVNPVDGHVYIAFVQPDSSAFYTSTSPNGYAVSANPYTQVTVIECSNPDASQPIWTSPIAVDPSTSDSEFEPAISIDASSGSVSVLYYTTNGTGDLSAVKPRLSTSIDGGTTWVHADLSSQTSNDAAIYPNSSGSNIYREYNGLAVVNGTVWAAWSSIDPTTQSFYAYATSSSLMSNSASYNSVTVAADPTDDGILVRRDPANTNYLQVQVNGVTKYDGLAASVRNMTVNGNGGNDTLTFDCGNGNPIGTALTFDGGSGTNTFAIKGSSGNDIFSTNGVSVALTTTSAMSLAYSNTQAVSYSTNGGTDSMSISGSVPVQLPAGTGSGINPIMLSSLTVGSGSKLSLLAASSHANRSVLVLSGTFAVNPTSGLLDAKDNDLIVKSGVLSTMESNLAGGRGTAPGGNANGRWNGSHGITSSTAQANDNSAEVNVLGIALNGSLPLGAYSSFDGQTVGTADVLVKYTYNGDATLDGLVDDNDITVQNLYYDGGVTTGHHWYQGDFNGDGKVDGTDITILGLFYGAGTTGSAYPRL